MRPASEAAEALRASLSEAANLSLPTRQLRVVLASLSHRGFALVGATYSRDTKPPKRSVVSNKRCPEHLVWIRTLPCAVPSCLNRPCEAAHVRMNTGGGMGMKPADRFALPLCRCHHKEQHTTGHRAFDAKHGIDSLKLAAKLAALSPALKPSGAANAGHEKRQPND